MYLMYVSNEAIVLRVTYQNKMNSIILRPISLSPTPPDNK